MRCHWCKYWQKTKRHLFFLTYYEDHRLINIKLYRFNPSTRISSEEMFSTRETGKQIKRTNTDADIQPPTHAWKKSSSSRFNHGGSPSLQSTLQHMQSRMHEIRTYTSSLNIFCQGKRLTHCTHSLTFTSPPPLYLHLSHCSQRRGLMCISCTVYMHKVLICSLFTVLPIHTSALMRLHHMSIKMEICGLVAHSAR